MSITIPPPAFAGSPAARETVGLASSGTSPGRIHLVGLGAVGRALLRRIAGREAPVIAATDSTATVYAKDGLAVLDLARIKGSGRRLIDVDGAEDLPTEFAVDVIESDVLVDAVESDGRELQRALDCVRFALRRRSRVLFASRQALAANAHAWRAEIASGRIGWNAALGGTGRLLAAELPDLARRCEEITLVPSAASTAVICALERGLEFDEAVAQAHVSRLLGADGTAEFDGTNVAEQLAIAAGAIFGHALDLERIERDDLRAIDVDLVRDRARRGFTTRFVGSARRDARPTVRLEEVPRGSILAAPCDRVVCAYRIDPRNLRVHVGRGLRPEGAASAILEDLFAPIGGAA